MLDIGDAETALTPIIAARQWATRGLEINTQEHMIEDFLLDGVFSSCATTIQRLGEKAVNKRDSEYLYRCMDAIGWLGCAAARKSNQTVGNICANALVQLGRISRAEKLPCFWTRCALLPADHAFERLEWILSWTVTLDQDARERWGTSLSEALSRLRGYKTTVQYVEQNGAWKYSLDSADKPHTYTVIDNGMPRVIDYSMFDELKEFNLY